MAKNGKNGNGKGKGKPATTGGKGKGKKPDAGEKETVTATARMVDNHGDCRDCGKVVDIVVDPWQCNTDGGFRCVECRAIRIEQKAIKDIGALKENAKRARESSKQGLLEFNK